MSTWYEDRNLRVGLAVAVVMIGAVLTATTGDSYAVRWVTLLLSLDVAARSALGGREG